ncbi:MAG: 1-(5-phosphoribosyl)-5-[(5-phosphoribosylamino)methylideneamino]imidazole-4-carboxamide isomerase [Deltaproteobacteria bacterium]|nr:1-(5-phosphoribosyl)-5-[(5-phosphoribosylamino)methylideneamino]imidazole-4-carboxamide isomerase [Deltaproteobacteria bacterium]
MLIIPAVDIKGGKCVRLEQGAMDRETVFSEHPEQMALQWERKGAKKLHLVDLDGAVAGRPVNKKAIQGITERLSIPVELGGGIRSLDAIEEYIDLGIHEVIIGSAAYKDPDLVRAACERFPGRIVVGIDARDEHVAVQGWTESTNVSAVEMAKGFEGVGVTSLIYTDIARDGMKSGPNIESIKSFVRATSLPVIAAGGISSVKDIEELVGLQGDGLRGIIIGRALYDGIINLKHILHVVNNKKM